MRWIQGDSETPITEKTEGISQVDGAPKLYWDCHVGGGSLGGLSRSRIWRLLSALLLSIIISYSPIAYGHFVLVEAGISTNDTMIFVLLPFLSIILMVASTITIRRLMRGSILFSVDWLGQNKRWSVLGAIVLPIVLFVGNVILLFALHGLRISTGHGTLFSTAKPGITLLIAYTLLMTAVTPVVEEIFWRGTIQDSLERISNGPLAFISQAIVFALVHFKGLGTIIQLFFLGFILGVWRWRKRTFLPLVVTHMACNTLFCVGLWSDYLELRKIRITNDYSVPLRELIRPADYTEEQNALPHYKRSFDLLVERPKKLTIADLMTWPAELAVEKLSQLHSWIKSNQKAIVRFEIATQKPYFCPDYSRIGLPSIWSSELQRVLPMISLILARAQVNAIEGNHGQCVSDIITCYRFGHHFAGPKPFLDQLTAIGIKESVVQVSFRILQRTVPDETFLKKFQIGLEAISKKEIAPIYFSGERFVCQDLIQCTFTDDGAGRGHIPRATIKQLKNPHSAIRTLGFHRPDREQINAWLKLRRKNTTKRADEVFDYLESIELSSPAQLRRAGKGIKGDLYRMVRGNAFLQEYTATFGNVFHRSHRCEASMSALILTVAIFRYRLDQGDLPNELKHLVQAGYLDILPLDPYSDIPFVYRKESSGFLLYSLGPDFDDDGGTRDNHNLNAIGGGDDVFWPPDDG